ncbi:chorismate mutase [Dongia sedimenti]|uniref:chorismate mutase n=1 Tax=Dongia sedimenti TaxID=3064282 RepID=A0ABU0YSF0_9PROT|nr:chorismate mutase [Rhodospirillaceae bacterium R-7]
MSADSEFPRPRCADMAEVRAAIDAIDKRLVALIAERLHYIDEAARIKPRRDLVRDEPRIADVLAKTRAESLRLGCDPAVVEAAYRALVEASITHEYVAFDSERSKT